jgi:hypothetical protein
LALEMGGNNPLIIKDITETILMPMSTKLYNLLLSVRANDVLAQDAYIFLIMPLYRRDWFND